MFNLIQQYMGDVSLWQLAGELILVILGIMATIAVWRAIKPSLKTHSKSLGALLWQRLCDEIEGIRERRILRQMNRSWRDWQQSELSPVGHKGWIFTILNLKCLEAMLRTTTGDYIIHITIQESGNVFGELLHRGRGIVHAEAKCYNPVELTSKRHAVTARLIQIANELAAGNEFERFPSGADVWCFIPAVQSGKTDMADGPRFGEPMKKVAAAMTALSNAAAQRKQETSPAMVALALLNGYVVDENKRIVVPYGENTPEAKGYTDRARMQLDSAGVYPEILFSYPDREAVPLGTPISEQLQVNNNYNNDNYDSAEAAAYKAAIQSDIPTDKLLEFAHASGDGHSIQTAARRIANGDISVEQHPHSIPQINPESAWVTNPDAGKDFVFHHDRNETTAWVWRCLEMSGPGVWFYGCNRNNFDFVIGTTYSQGHGIVSTLYIQPAGMVGVNSLRKIITLSRLHTMDIESQWWVSKINSILECVAWDIGTHFGWNLAQFVKDLPLGYGGYNSPAELFQNATTMLQFMHVNTTALIGDMSPDLTPRYPGQDDGGSMPEVPESQTPVWTILKDMHDRFELQLQRGNGCYRIDSVSRYDTPNNVYLITAELFLEYRIAGTSAPLLLSLMTLTNELSPVGKPNLKDDIEKAVRSTGEQVVAEVDRRIKLGADDVMLGIVPPTEGREQ